MIRVMVADDHPLVREGLKSILSDCPDIVYAGDADNGNVLQAKLAEEQFDVVLLDMFMPGKHGIELIKIIKDDYAKMPILVLSTHKEDIYAVRTIKAGAAGYMCKDYAASELINAIRKVASGGRYISPAVGELMANEMHHKSSEALLHTLLSDREYQVFLLTASGLGTKEIADKLNVSVKTVSTHKARIKDKTRLSNTSEIVRYAMKHALITEDADMHLK